MLSACCASLTVTCFLYGGWYICARVCPFLTISEQACDYDLHLLVWAGIWVCVFAFVHGCGYCMRHVPVYTVGRILGAYDFMCEGACMCKRHPQHHCGSVFVCVPVFVCCPIIYQGKRYEEHLFAQSPGIGDIRSSEPVGTTHTCWVQRQTYIALQ